MKTHGESRSVKEYRTWRNLKDRCLNPKNPRNKNYAKRGISVCARWRNSYENFLADMGRAPSANHSIERRDNNGNYEPGNCYWATAYDQNNNMTKNIVITHNGTTKTLSQHCKDLKLRYGTIHMRINSYGWTVQRALST